MNLIYKNAIYCLEGEIKPRKPSTSSFKNWFGYSRIPLVYHATSQNFTIFDIDRSDLGAHFGTKEQAEYVLKHRLGGNGKVMPFWINLHNPLKLKDEGSFNASAIAGQLLRMKLISKELFKEIAIAGYKEDKKYNKIVRDILIKAGYDGAYYKNTNEGDANSYIVFDAKNIKSADSNSGEYSESPDFTQE